MRACTHGGGLLQPMDPVGRQGSNTAEFHPLRELVFEGVAPMTWPVSSCDSSSQKTSSGLGCTMYNVPDRPSSAKVAPVGCQLATMALKSKTFVIPKDGFAWQKLSPSLGHQCIWGQLMHGTGRLSATLEVNRLRRCRATRPRKPLA